jgi:hypothetical protein
MSRRLCLHNHYFPALAGVIETVETIERKDFLRVLMTSLTPVIVPPAPTPDTSVVIVCATHDTLRVDYCDRQGRQWSQNRCFRACRSAIYIWI